MGSVYKRGPWWWMAFRLPGSGRVARSTKVPSSAPEREAREVLDEMERELANETTREVGAKTTVAEYALSWTALRKDARQMNAQRDFERLKIHVFPDIGAKRLGSVRPSDVRGLVKKLKASELAPRTIINTFGLVRRLFLDALADELISSSPCVLRKGDLPKKRDKNPSWRAGAVFSREETELLLTSPLVPQDSRVCHALGLLAGMREGEISALRWGSFERATKPLPRLLVVASYTQRNKVEKSTKTGSPREVPVHPVLLRILTDWEQHGFAEYFGRSPQPGDLLIPNRWGRHRIDTTFNDGLRRDLKALGLRHRTMHNTRRTFISLGRTDGANPAVLKTVTHDQTGDQFDQYTTFTFEAKCEAVLHLKLGGRAATSMSLKMAAGDDSYTDATQEEEPMAGMRIRSDFSEPSGGSIPSILTGHLSSQPATPSGAGAGGRHRQPLKSVPRSNVATQAIESDLEAALSDFRSRGDRKRLAARLRQLLITVRR